MKLRYRFFGAKMIFSFQELKNKYFFQTKRSGIPSLFDKTITNNPMKSGDQPIGVILRIEGEAERVFYPPPSFMEPKLNIVPRLPNGIPLIGVPSSHGRAGFGANYQDQARMAAGGGMAGMPMGWENQVNAFLNNTTKSKSRGRDTRKRRSSSYSSTSSSSDGRSRSRSSSRSDRRRRDDRKRPREDRDRKDYRRDGRRDGRRDDRKRHDDRRRDSYHRDSDKDIKRRKEQSKHSAMESAKALGLSNDYIDQVNEQKRKREEIVRKKEERRHAPVSEKKEVPTTVSTNTSSAAYANSKDKTKAYLAVNVTGVQQLPTAVKKIEAIASELGPIKKCWRSDEDVVSIIFNAHDKAKDFMLKHNG